MKNKWIIVLPLLLTQITVPAQSSNPITKQEAKTVNEFVPVGWKTI
jgi:hypothetical protein